MTNRMDVVSAIQDYVALCHSEGKVLDVTAAALELTRTYPQCGLTLNDICDQLEQAAIRRQVTISVRAARPTTKPKRPRSDLLRPAE